MAKLTECRNTPELCVNAVKYSYKRTAGAAILAGALVAQDSAGLVVPAGDAANLNVLGRAENSAAAGENVVIKRAVFLYDNAADAEALSVSDIGKDCFALDDATVGKIGGTNKVKAGTVLDVTAEGVAVII